MSMPTEEEEQISSSVSSSSTSFSGLNFDDHGVGLLHRRPIRTRKPFDLDDNNATKEEMDIAELEPLTPAGRVFCTPSLNTSIFVTLGFKTACHPHALKDGIRRTLLHHKRFSSLLKEDEKGTIYWTPTTVNLDDHIKVVSPEDADAASPTFVADYVAELMQIPLDLSKPLFEFHIVKAKLGDAMENVVMKVHHSMGDGVSLMSLLISCTRRVDQPDTMPTLPSYTKKSNWNDKGSLLWSIFYLLWRFVLIIWHTLCDATTFTATCLWLKDSSTCLKGYDGIEKSSRNFVYTTVPFSDLRLVKQSTDATINDVVYGMLVAAISRYLWEKYDSSESNSKTKSWTRQRVRACVIFNTRPSPGLHEIQKMMEGGSQARWGNDIGYVLMPVPLFAPQDPLQYVHEAKRIFNKKKLSFGPIFSYRSGSLLMKLTGLEMPTKLTYRCVANTTLSFSNVVGPMEQIEFFGHPITHILPTSAGFPQALCVHCVSYMGQVSIVLSAAKDIIPDPEKISKYMTDALKDMRIRCDES